MKVISALLIFGIIVVTYAAFVPELAVPPKVGVDECPEWDGDNVTLLPHETNCRKFYICNMGKPVLKTCPNKLHFNNKEKVCDWPWEACCDVKKYPNKKCSKQ